MNPSQSNNSWYPWLVSGGMLGAGLGDMFGGSKNPANAAMPYLNQIPGMLGNNFNPYIQAGQNALPTLQSQYAAMMNPNFINQMGKSFQQSPGLQFQMDQATQAANRAAAAGGSLGTPAEQQNLANVTSGLANQDYYNWLNHAMGAQDTALQGESGLAQMGLNAGSQMSSDMMDAMMSQAQLAYTGQQNQNQQHGIDWGSILGGGLGLAGSFFGGPVGGAIGKAVGNWF